MIEKKFDEITQIGGWFISKDLCDEVVDYFNFNKKYQEAGTVYTDSKNGVNKDIKDSVDLNVSAGNLDGPIGQYRIHLQRVLDLYLKKYEQADKVEPFGIKEDYNIQKYSIGGGFKQWHAENTGDQLNRHLVFMTYLNDVEDGGTEFMYQNIKTQAEKGLTIIWPAIWTHTHRGIVSSTSEKIIVTGWYNFL